MPSQEPIRNPSELPPSRQPAARHVSAEGGVAVGGDVTCADFVGHDQVNITYGYTAADLERLIEKVLAFLQSGAVFAPHGAKRCGPR